MKTNKNTIKAGNKRIDRSGNRPIYALQPIAKETDREMTNVLYITTILNPNIKLDYWLFITLL
jgi:hypothetical protein